MFWHFATFSFTSVSMVTSFAVAKNSSPLVEDIGVLYEVGPAYNVGIHVHLAVGNPENEVQPRIKRKNR